MGKYNQSCICSYSNNAQTKAKFTRNERFGQGRNTKINSSKQMRVLKHRTADVAVFVSQEGGRLSGAMLLKIHWMDAVSILWIME